MKPRCQGGPPILSGLRPLSEDARPRVNPLASSGAVHSGLSRSKTRLRFLVLRHRRRELLYIGVIDQPTAAGPAQQILHAFPDETGPAYLLR